MRLRGLGLSIFACLYCGLIAAVFPGARDRALAIAALIVLAYFVSLVIRIGIDSARKKSSPFDDARKRGRATLQRPPDLVRIETALGYKTYTRGEFEHRAGPLLRELTSYRLRARSLGDLGADSAGVREHLSDRLWETVMSPGARREGDATRHDPSAKRIETSDIQALLDEIEGL